MKFWSKVFAFAVAAMLVLTCAMPAFALQGGSLMLYNSLFDNEWTVSERLGAIAQARNCAIHATLEEELREQYSSVDDYFERIRQLEFYSGENTIIFIYIENLNAARIYIGKDIESTGESTDEIVSMLCDTSIDTEERVLAAIDALSNFLGVENDNLTIMGNLVVTDEDRQRVNEILSPLRAKHDGHIFLSLLSDSNSSVDETLDYVIENGTFDIDSSIIIAYASDTGQTAISVGSKAEIELKDVDSVAGKFQAGTDNDKFSGFEAGINAMVETLNGESSNGIGSMWILVCGIGAAAVIIIVAAVIWRKKQTAHKTAR